MPAPRKLNNWSNYCVPDLQYSACRHRCINNSKCRYNSGSWLMLCKFMMIVNGHLICGYAVTSLQHCSLLLNHRCCHSEKNLSIRADTGQKSDQYLVFWSSVLYGNRHITMNLCVACIYLWSLSPIECVPTAFWLACCPKLLALCLTQVALAARPLASCHVSHRPWGWELLSALWNKQVLRGLVLQFEFPDSVIRCVFVASPLRQNMMATSQPRSISLVHLTCQLITGCCYLSLNKTLN